MSKSNNYRWFARNRYIRVLIHVVIGLPFHIGCGLKDGVGEWLRALAEYWQE